MTRRGYGTGTVYQRKDGKWVGRFDIGRTASGARRRKTVVAKSKREAARRLRDAQREYETNSFYTLDPTLAAYVDIWLQDAAKRTRQTTLTSYGVIAKRIKQTLGGIKLSQLTAAHVRLLAQKLSEQKLKPVTIQSTLTGLRQILRQAQSEDYKINPNVLNFRMPLSQEGNGRIALTPQQAAKAISAAVNLPRQESSGMHYSRWLVALLEGLRQGECLGLRWCDINFTDRVINVTCQLQQLNPSKPSGYDQVVHIYEKFYLVPPKSGSGVRRVPMVEPVTRALLEWHQLWPGNPWDFVWTSHKNKPITRFIDIGWWDQIQKAAGISKPDGSRFVPHEARHTTASLLLAAQVRESVIVQILGHTKIATSERYMHLNEPQAVEALSAAAKLLALPSGNT